MENSDMSKDRHNDHLGVNRLGKNIRKSPLHQPNFGNSARQQPQPQVYNISKNDFRNIVQKLTGSPSRAQEALPRPTQNPPKPPSMRLQKIRPAPLTPPSRPHVCNPAPAMGPGPAPVPALAPYSGIARPLQFGQPSPSMPADSVWANPAESPVSAFMRYLIDPGPKQTPPAQLHPQSHPPQSHLQPQSHPHQSHLQPQTHPPLPHLQPQTHPPQPHPQPRSYPPPHLQPQSHPPQPDLQPQLAGQLPDQPPSSALLPNPYGPSLASPTVNGPGLLPSPTSQYLLPSPTGFMNLLSPRSPYPLLSPGFQFPPPLTPNFSFSPIGQSGILGPGPQPPLSPGAFFPLSPSGLFPSPKPGWRNG